MDIYWPDTDEPAPLVVVAHGFSRRPRNMIGWGRHLASAGFVAAVPNLPSWSDQVLNGRFLSDLCAQLCAHDTWKERIDPERVGLMGFSAGGLASLLAAADNPRVSIWVGLDSVDRNGLGAKAAPLVKCHAVVLTAEPSACNAHGNARQIIDALPTCEKFKVVDAVHVDAEWPTSWMAQLVCGRSADERRNEFVQHATVALHKALALPPAVDVQGIVG